MKKKISEFLMEAIIFIAIFFCFLLLFIACKTPIKTQITTESDSIRIYNLSVVKNDSIIKQILSTLTFDYDYTIKKFSTPDSSGEQYVEEEHHIKGNVKQNVETKETVISNSNVKQNDSSSTKKKETMISTPVKTLNWWDKVRIKIGDVGIVIIILAIGYILFWLIRKKKDK